MNKSSPSGKDILTWKLNDSPEYAEKIINDYDFAREQFSMAGMEINIEAHEEFRKAYHALSKSAMNLFVGKPNLKVIFAV